MSKKYKSYSKEDKLSLLRDYYQSGLSKNSFCKSRGIAAVKSLNTWLKVFTNEKDLLSLQDQKSKSGFGKSSGRVVTTNIVRFFLLCLSN